MMRSFSVIAAALLTTPAYGLVQHSAAVLRHRFPSSTAIHPRPALLVSESTASTSASVNVVSRHTPAKLGLFGSDEPPVAAMRSTLFGIGWFSWWSQAILSTVSLVLFLFANSVTKYITRAPNPIQ